MNRGFYVRNKTILTIIDNDFSSDKLICHVIWWDLDLFAKVPVSYKTCLRDIEIGHVVILVAVRVAVSRDCVW